MGPICQSQFEKSWGSTAPKKTGQGGWQNLKLFQWLGSTTNQGLSICLKYLHSSQKDPSKAPLLHQIPENLFRPGTSIKKNTKRILMKFWKPCWHHIWLMWNWRLHVHVHGKRPVAWIYLSVYHLSIYRSIPPSIYDLYLSYLSTYLSVRIYHTIHTVLHCMQVCILCIYQWYTSYSIHYIWLSL